MYSNERPSEHRKIISAYAIPGKFKIILADSIPHDSKHNKRQSMNINPKFGSIYFGKHSIEAMGLKVNDRISFVVIDDMFFVYKSKNGCCKMSVGEPSGLRSQSRRVGTLLSNALVSTHANKSKSINFRVVETNAFFDGNRLFELKANYSTRLYFKTQAGA